MGLIVSSAARNFIDFAFARANHAPLLTCESRVAVSGLDSHSLGSGWIQFLTPPNIQLNTLSSHKETIRLSAVDSLLCSVILGLSWLDTHNPTITWLSHTLTFTSAFCQCQCLQGGVQKSSGPAPPASTCSLNQDLSGSTDVGEGVFVIAILGSGRNIKQKAYHEASSSSVVWLYQLVSYLVQQIDIFV